jgi:hypothetical protein
LKTKGGTVLLAKNIWAYYPKFSVSFHLDEALAFPAGNSPGALSIWRGAPVFRSEDRFNYMILFTLGMGGVQPNPVNCRRFWGAERGKPIQW